MSNFDFDKAINGEPIYCNGERVYPSYQPMSSTFFITDLPRTDYVWSKKGVSFSDKADLTTDPPKKKVKKTMYIRAFIWESGSISSSALMSKEDADKFCLHNSLKDLGTYPIEIEVGE